MKSGFIDKKLLVLCILVMLWQRGHAQLTPNQGLYFGLDALKSVSVLGAVAEPNLRYFTQNNWVFGIAYGYVNFRHDSVHYNLNYRNRGSYYKPAIEFMFPDLPVSVGLGYLFSSTHETGHADFKGPYFGDKRLEVARKIRTRGFEISTNAHIPVSRRWLFSFGARANFIRNQIISGNFREVPLYYIGGAGYVLDKQNASRTTTGGFSFAVSYRLTGKNANSENEAEY